MRKAWNKLTHEQGMNNMKLRKDIDLYTFDNFIYTKSADKSFITCKKHGDFEISYNNFMKGRNCPECKKDKLRFLKQKQYGYNTDIIIDLFKEKYQNKYDYSLVKYKRKKLKVKIICPKHGIFEKSPHHHLIGQECQILTLCLDGCMIMIF